MLNLILNSISKVRQVVNFSQSGETTEDQFALCKPKILFRVDLVSEPTADPGTAMGRN